jgi:hypothetical protein
LVAKNRSISGRGNRILTLVSPYQLDVSNVDN